MRQLSLHVNDREGPNTSGSRLSQLGDTCAEDNRKLAKAFSFVLPVLELVFCSSRVGALVVTDAMEGTHRYSVEPASLPHGENTPHSPFSSNPHDKICGDSEAASCALADVFQSGFWTLAFGRLSLSQWTPPVHVEIDRMQFFSIELDFKIVLRGRALMPGSSRTRGRSAKISPRSTTSAIFLHRCTGRNASKRLEALTPSGESCI